MSTSRDLVATVCDEARAFDARHPDLRDHPGRAAGMLAFGLLRAIAACPDCGPGIFRTSPDGWHTLVCPQCRGVWVHAPQAEVPAQPAPRRRRGPARRR